MGACYSKNTGVRTSAEGKGSKLKHRLLEQNKKLNVEELSLEKVSPKDNERSLECKIDSPNTRIIRTSIADLVSDHVNLKQVDHSIAPSDSGIESIGTAQDEAHVSARSKQERDELMKQLEHQNLRVCQNCGHLKLNDFSLLTNSDILCNQSLTGKSIIKPKWESHSLQTKESASMNGETKYDQDHRVFTDSNENATVSNSSDITNCAHKDTDNSELRSGLEELNSVKKDTSSLSVQETNSCSNSHTSTSVDKNKISEVIIEEKSRAKAPLAQYDSLDTNLNDDRASQEQNLLSNFQDITDALCKCDSYSNHEKDHGNNANASEGTQVVSIAECGAGGQSVDADEQSNHLTITGQESPHLNQSSIHNHSKTYKNSSSQKLSFLSMGESSILPTDTPLAHHKVTNSQVVTKSASPSTARPIPVSREVHVSHCESSISESSSGVYTHQTVSRSLFSNGQKDASQCSASLGSVDAMISGSSSDNLVSGTEDDLTSLDLDNSRFNSQSVVSIRQQMESGEVASSLQIALPTIVDGMDCVIIPKETYQQMQTDLSVLKQQLICLSSLIQESEEPEKNTGCEADT